MQRGAPADGDQAQSRGFFGGCAECCRTIPAGTRTLCFAVLVGALIGFFVGGYLVNCAGMVVSGVQRECLPASPSRLALPALVALLATRSLAPRSLFRRSSPHARLTRQVWRIVFAPLVSYSFFGAIWSLLLLYGTGAMLEMQRGTLYLMHATLVISLLSQLLFFLTFFVVGWNPLYSVTGARSCSSTSNMSSGMWATCFGLMVLETQRSPVEVRRFMCFPCDVPTKYYPVALLIFFELLTYVLSQTLMWDIAFGVLVGYLVSSSPRLQLSDERARALEHSPRLQWLVSKELFISVDMAGGGAGGGGGGGLFGMGVPPRSAADVEAGRAPGRVHGSGAVGGRVGGAAAAGATGPARPSVFATSPGHRLDEGAAGGGGGGGGLGSIFGFGRASAPAAAPAAVGSGGEGALAASALLLRSQPSRIARPLCPQLVALALRSPIELHVRRPLPRAPRVRRAARRSPWRAPLPRRTARSS
jgi:hypothetical protein